MTSYISHFNSDVGLVRKANEDYFQVVSSSEINNNGDLFIVCDGMGGHVGGRIASQLATESIVGFFESMFHENPILALDKAIMHAHNQILTKSQSNPELKGMGTTCVVALYRDDDLYIGHVGDSRVYVITNNSIKRLTKDHSYVQKLVDRGELKDEQMESHPRKNELTQALGASGEVKPTIS